jgi:hypothetical protein
LPGADARTDSLAPAEPPIAGNAPAASSGSVAEPEHKATASRASGNTLNKIVVTTVAPKTLAAGQKAISRTRLEIGSRAAAFRLTGVSALKGKAFALREPDRVVLDLDGSWGVSLAKTPANGLIKSVRAGSQGANTRLVFDLYNAPKSFKLVHIEPRTLELQMR